MKLEDLNLFSKHTFCILGHSSSSSSSLSELLSFPSIKDVLRVFRLTSQEKPEETCSRGAGGLLLASFYRTRKIIMKLKKTCINKIHQFILEAKCKHSLPLLACFLW